MRRYNLKEEVIAALTSTSVPLTKLGPMIGVSIRHLYKVRTGETANPQVDELQIIHDWFIEHPKSRK